MRVLHVITGLGTGGAEAMLVKLATATSAAVTQCVVSLLDEGTYGAVLEAAGIPVVALRAGGVRDLPRAVRAVRREVRAFAPDLVHTWMYHANVVGGLAALGTGRPVLWNIRANRITRDVERTATVLLARASGPLGWLVASRIVCNSDAAMQAHAGWGYPRGRMLRVDNGFDTARLVPDPAARQALRDQLGVADDVSLVGMLGRYSPIKGHDAFIAAALQVAGHGSAPHFVLAGPGVDATASPLREAARPLGGRVHLLRPTKPEAFFPALDLAVVPSVDEAFPNVLGEALSCGVPAVATDVGDCARVLGDAGRVVPPRDPAALAAAITAILDLPAAVRQGLGRSGRARMDREFSRARNAERYVALYRELAR
ncbi:MAG: glycosyltransferase [Gemmatimonadota bacterium]